MSTYDRRAADSKDNSFGRGYYPLPATLRGLGRFVDNLRPDALVDHQVYPDEGVHLLTAHVNERFSIMAEDMKSLLKHGLLRIQCNKPGTLTFYFQDKPLSAPTPTDGSAMQQAYRLGQEAFKRGMSRVPAGDVALADLLHQAPGQGVDKARVVNNLMGRWLNGWDQANLAAPVE